MNFVLIHIGNNLPDHIKYCIKQIRYTNPNSMIYFITNLNIVQPDPMIKLVDTKTLNVPDIGEYYKHDTYSELWRNAVLRIFYIESFLKQSGIKDIVHFDNDVLIYENVETIADKLKQFNFIMTSHFKGQYVFGFSYIKDAASLTKINEELIKLVVLGEHKLKDIIPCDMPHEMSLLSYINDVNNHELISNLPLLPEGVGSDNFKLFNVCFDPSTYGKHIGGSHEHGAHNKYFVPTEKWTGTESKHDIGRAIINKKITVDFIDNKPIIIDDNNNVHKIFNLHIHSKDLKRWMSKNI